MNEATLRREVMDYALRLGVLVHYCRDSTRCQGHPGLPDLVLLGPGGILLAELKGPDGETSPDQDAWLATAHEAGVPYAVWYPSSWEDGTIEAALRRLAKPKT
ncbi:MAG TPA: VRR-NUC domain-containing protein [Streptosporangiaceae bacterium]|nr:VRR-NUC domain-containing protein [Streptosporangiaceae bacterium]